MPTTDLGRVCMVPRGTYAQGTTYNPLDIVRNAGKTYVVRKKVTNVTPAEGEYYMLISADGEKGDTGVTGPQGPAGSDATVTADNVKSALGYTPANSAILPINVMDYGAKGNGTDDDTTAILAAISTQAKGGSIYFPSGEYKVSGTIAVPAWKELIFSGSTVIVTTSTTLPVIKVGRYSKVNGNGAVIFVPYNYAGHVIECYTDNDLTNAEETSETPFAGAMPLWRLKRTVDDVGIIKCKSSSSRQGAVENIANICGDAVYIGAKDIIGTNLSAGSNSQWLTSVNANVCGGFANGFHLEVSDTASWMNDISISGAAEGCETGVLIDGCSNTYCDVMIQPHTTTAGIKFAKNGIKLVNSSNIDLSRSKVWDWSNANTLRVGYPPTDTNQAYALIGNSRGTKIVDFGMSNSGNSFYERIYSDEIGNLLTADIVGAKGKIPPPTAYAFYKNFRNGSQAFNSKNVSWRDNINMTRYDVPITPLNAWNNQNQLYKIGYFDFGEAENPDTATPDVLASETITIEEVDSRGIYGYSNINFTPTTANHYWNPVGFGYKGRSPIYFFTSSGTRRTLYKLVRDAYDIQQIYNCKITISNARRFIFDFANAGEVGSATVDTYTFLTPQYADGADLLFAGMVGVKNGKPSICTETAKFATDGSITTAATIKTILTEEDLETWNGGSY